MKKMFIFSGKAGNTVPSDDAEKKSEPGANQDAAPWSLSGTISKAAGSMAGKAVESAVSSGLAGKALSGATAVAGTSLVGKVAMGAAKGAVSGALGEVPVVSGIIRAGEPNYQDQIRKAKKRAVVISVAGLIVGLLLGHFVL